jgi:hypothetical protein
MYPLLADRLEHNATTNKQYESITTIYSQLENKTTYCSKLLQYIKVNHGESGIIYSVKLIGTDTLSFAC